MTDQTSDQPEQTGTSRRDFIKKSAIATGAAWAAPTVMNVGPAAFATVGSPITVEQQCSETGNLYRFKWNADSTSGSTNSGDGSYELGLKDGDANFKNGCGAPDGWDAGTNLENGYMMPAADGGGSVIAAVNDNGSVTFTLPGGCVFEAVSAKAGSVEADGTFACSENVSPQSGTSFTVTMNSGKAVSDAGIVFCCS